MKTKPTLGQRLRYAFDNTMARGTPALVGWLAIATLALIAVFSVIVLAGGIAPEPEGGGDKPGVIRQRFNSLLHALDPGTVAGDDGAWYFLLTMLLLTLAGLFIVSALIGVIATGLDERLQQLRKGRSFVIERDHTLILGWSDTVFTVLSELAIANENEKDPVVVILAPKDKAEMDDSIRDKVADMGGTRVVCRTGSPIDIADLGIVNPLEARSVIVLSPTDDPDPDSQVVKVLLALVKGPHRREAPYNLVAEIQDPANLEAARVAGGEYTVLVDKSETISRLIVQSSRQQGISAVYTELLDFAGDEIYFRADPALEGESFGRALSAYEECCVIGIASNGSVRLNPDSTTPIGAGDSLVAIAADDSQLDAAAIVDPAIDESAIVTSTQTPPPAQRVLLLGWNGRATAVIRELDKYMKPGSEVVVAAEVAEAEDELGLEARALANLTTRFEIANTSDRRTLERLDPHAFDSVIVLCYSDLLDTQRADARTLVTLLHLRELEPAGSAVLTIVSEMLDDRNRELAEVTRVNDVIVSDRVISLMLAQLSENDRLTKVFAELFAAEGSEVYLRPARDYVTPGTEVTFATVVEAARRRGESAIGVDVKSDGGVRVNPPKSERVTLVQGDRVVVLAED